ncbi:hypothetical protein MSG28_000003 [Choristoneura fumiferana]|uniref:Uncharacterized protein n=1 Tax=Choristoneura fumiferana TaxID=7141 RepID=A0ACC0JYZ3_CHOFU|nr:hypothetical protein MSG28_000003 [Choristoneura fumiferana]
MAAQSAESERSRLYKFTKILTLKVAQIVVQSREGKKVTRGCQESKTLDNGPLSTSPANLQWFNLSIPDEPEVNYDTKRILNGEVVTALTNILCIEISLKTIDGDEMVLELWTVKLAPCIEAPITSVSTIYYRMSVMLKSTLSISRITPAYKMARSQNNETYKIYHKIYVMYRTKMTMLPGDRLKPADILNSNSSIMPLTAGAFVDHDKMRELHEMLNRQLPPEPPLSWLLAEQERSDTECVQLRSASDEWTDVLTETSTDSDTLSQQLKMYEDAVPEFDNMVASMFSNSDTSEN